MLTDIDYVQLINQKITNIEKKIHSWILKNFEGISNAPICFRIKDHISLETLPIDIRGKTILYATLKKTSKMKLKNTKKKKLNYQNKMQTINKLS